MSSFEILILSAPISFMSGCGELNGLENEKLDIAIKSAIKSTREGYMTTPAISMNECIKTLMYIIRARNNCKPQPEVTELASVLDSHTVLSRACITSIVEGLESYPIPSNSRLPPTESSEESTTNIEGESSSCTRRGGKLAGLQWRLGVALASSSCKSLLSPYVSMSFTVTDSNGEKNVQTVEMTYKEFQQFYGSVKQAANTMAAL